ncbi:chemotaxis methyltransferase CheR [Janthinobacterium lividum]|nr:chemotaxis methyltransferase CheR [Janthinobacterium lividum]
MRWMLLDDDIFDIELKLLLEGILLRYQHDFRDYSVASLRRRMRQAMERFGCASLSQLQDRILHEPAMFAQMLQFFTVQVSEMFRDPAYFRALREKVVPILHTYPSIKIWVAGCSSGEEVWSLAILLEEEGLLERSMIYATDINVEALAAAEAGIYPSSASPSSARITSWRAASARCPTITRPPTRAPSLTGACGASSSSPTTALRRTACFRRCTWFPAVTS